MSERALPPLRSVRFRIAAAFLLALAAPLGSLVFLVDRYQEVGRLQALLTQAYVPIAQGVGALRAFQQRVDTDLDRLQRAERRPGTGPASATHLYSEALSLTLAELKVHARSGAALVRQPNERAQLHKVEAELNTIERLFGSYEQESAALLAGLEAGGSRPPEATEALTRTRDALRDEIDHLGSEVESRIAALTAETDRTRSRATALASALSLGSAALSTVLLVAVLAALSPIGRLTSGVQRLARGDYGSRLTLRGDDEIGALAREFNTMADAIEARDRVLVERADELRRLSGYLSSVLDTLDDGLLVWEGERLSLANPRGRKLMDDPDLGPLIPAWIAEPGSREVVDPLGRTWQVRVNAFGDRGRLVVLSDITASTRAKEQLARSERLAWVGQMLAQIAHEVRNPLNALSLNAELLGDELVHLEPARRQEAMEILALLTNQVHRLEAVTGHYLQLARRPRPQLSRVDLGGLLRDLVRLLEPELARQEVALVLQVEPLPAQALDGGQFTQALLNVVRNAVEAGAHHLELQLRATETTVRLSLRDDGPGLTREQIARATDPFFSTKATGTGLGLAIVRQVLEDHEGRVTLQNREAGGTEVALELPRRDFREDADPLVLA